MIIPLVEHGYAVGTGTYVGEILVYIEEDETDYEFISIPKNINRKIPKDKFVFGVENKILEDIGPIDHDVYILLNKQFDFNKNLDK